MSPGKGSEKLDRERLLSGFLAAVKVCQVRYGGRTELATESDPRVATLCQCLEETLTHGLRIRIPNRSIGAIRQVTDLVSSGLNLHLTLGSSEPEKPVLWWYVRELLTRHEYDRFLLLRQVTSDQGRGRAWLRSLLNEHSLERYIHIMVSDEAFLELWYEPWALLRDQERAAMLPNLAAGLDSILFAINIDNEVFNTGATKPSTISFKESSDGPKHVEPEPQLAQLADISSENCIHARRVDHKRRKKKIPSNLVSFDEDVLNSSQSPPFSPATTASISGYFSAPATSVSSPSTTSSSVTPYSDSFNRSRENKQLEEVKEKLKTSNVTEIDLSKSSIDSKCIQRPTSLLPKNVLEINTKSEDECPTMTVEELSYNQVLEDLLASQSFDFTSSSGSSNKKCGDKLSFQCFADQECSSYKSGLSNNSGDSYQSSEGEQAAGHTSLTPLRGGPTGLIPLSPDGEAIFNFNSAEDGGSMKSSSQDDGENEVGAVDCEMIEKKQHSSSPSASMGSINSEASLLSSPISKASTVTAPSFSSLTFDELRTAALEISRGRDLAEEKRVEVAAALSREMETSSMLRAQLTHEQSQHAEAIDKLTTKINALMRENELLRHQLKKYVGAVQMLRRDGMEGDGSVYGEELLIRPTRQPPDLRDYHGEAEAYEGKLIQVAEMHGELMEFNERLQRLLKYRESQVRRLKEELVELRGPLPNEEEVYDFDDTLSITSDFDTLSSPRTLINIWIPTAFLAGPSSDTHHVYQIYVRIKDDEWNVYRRFAQFYELHRQFKKKESVVKTFDFPQKKTFGYKDIGVVENRRIRLQQYLRCLVNVLVTSHPNLSSEPDKNLLTSLLPFLSDAPESRESTATKSKNTRKFLSRLSNRQENSPQPTQPSPQYNGL